MICDLVFEYTSKYPDEAPKIEIEEENFEPDVRGKLMDALKQTIEENLGMEMIFGIVGAAQELLNSLFDQMKIDREEAKEKKAKEEEEKERKKFEGKILFHIPERSKIFSISTSNIISGTVVNVETFMKWKTDFEAEMGIAAQRAKENDANRKPTGKELFMRDKSLLDSDIIFLQSQGDSVENVKIDESLFQNLDLNEELPSDSDDDDPDWKPS